MGKYYCPHCGVNAGIMGHDCEEGRKNQERPANQKVYKPHPYANYCPNCSCASCQAYQRGARGE